MAIIIPTRSRTNDQLTVQNLPKQLMDRVTLVCQTKKEANKISSLRSDFEVIAQPDPEWGIARKRDWIIEEWVRRGFDKVFMLDDDLRFATRVSEDDWHLRPIIGEELVQEFQRIEDKLGPEFPHAGFGQRQGNNMLEGAGWKSPGKQVCTLGYYLPIVANEVRWDLVELREDMCVTLQLLLKGYPNAIWTETTHDQRKFDAPGGCSTYRTEAMNNEEAKKLAALFPNYVDLAHRKYKTGAERIEVIIKWQQALKEGTNARNRSV
jgi:hypothetical protein